MLATAITEPFCDPEWLYEIKWDGYRALAFLQEGRIRLFSRNGNELTPQYPELAPLASAIRAHSAIPMILPTDWPCTRPLASRVWKAWSSLSQLSFRQQVRYDRREGFPSYASARGKCFRKEPGSGAISHSANYKETLRMAKQWTAALVLGLLAVSAFAQDTPALKDQKEKFSYALGADLGGSLRKQAIDVDPAIVAKGLADAFSGGKMLLTEDEIRAALTTAQEEIRQKQAALRAQRAETAKKEGEVFLAANKAKEGIVSLPSGLQYKILTAGTGAKPTADDTVVCQYRGTLLDGTEFDSSYKRNQPATFQVKGVIKGWTEALQLMPAGSKWQLFIPSDLAYGATGAHDPSGREVIPANATLIFEVELVSIQDKTAKP